MTAPPMEEQMQGSVPTKRTVGRNTAARASHKAAPAPAPKAEEDEEGEEDEEDEEDEGDIEEADQEEPAEWTEGVAPKGVDINELFRRMGRGEEGGAVRL